MDPDERRLVLPRQSDPRRAVRFVADDQVEVGHPLTLGPGDDVDALVGREHDRELLVGVSGAQLARQCGGVGRRRIDEVLDPDVFGGSSADLVVRADRERPERDLALLLPLPQRLVEELDARDEEQDLRRPRLVVQGDLLGDLQARERLAGPASHDQLAPVAGEEAVEDGVLGLPLMRAQRLLAGRRQESLDLAVPVDRRPVDLGVEQVVDADPDHRRGQCRHLRLEVRTPVPRGRDDHPRGEVRGVARCDEGVDVLLGQVVVRGIELALDRAPPTRNQVPGDQVDPRVTTLTLRPVVPQVHLTEPVGILRRCA